VCVCTSLFSYRALWLQAYLTAVSYSGGSLQESRFTIEVIDLLIFGVVFVLLYALPTLK
jgi:hypothetical protein